MKANSQTRTITDDGFAAMLREYYQLTKPRVVALIIFTAVVGMFLSTPGMVDLDILVLGTLGIGLAAASGAAMNHILDRDADSVMKRTRNRPLPTGKVNAMAAMIFFISPVVPRRRSTGATVTIGFTVALVTTS